jgi:NADPH-dependent 2,4-dienoyl-CoA reductase/sulfur reductase-like enzyme/nitrite reductase/ring-hydroxylating ferredoxin subunit
MGTDQAKARGPDLAQGVAAGSLPDGQMLVGHVGQDPVLLIRSGAQFFAIGAVCSHYNGPLGEGLLVGDTVRCPWHHACFSVRTGEALQAPALSPVACWSVEQLDGKVFVKTRKPSATAGGAGSGTDGRPPERIVILGAGGAGFAAAEMLRRERYAGRIVMLSHEDLPPVDRPNLSKDYLAGKAPEDWLPLRPDDFYTQNEIELRLGQRAARIDVTSREVGLANGESVAFDRLLIATGAEPNRLQIPGFDLPHVSTLRSLADCRGIIARAARARRAVVLGASFIGLEVAAALRARSIEVHVVAPDAPPMERILGRALADTILALHQEHGVVFHLEDTPVAIDAGQVRLKSGLALDADLVVAGVGVRPRTQLAADAGLDIDRGVVVDPCLQTSAAGVYAAGDIARWHDPHSGEHIRVEHWVVAQRQGQTAALNMLGRRQRFDAVPFFWSQHYGTPINYVGHADAWDELQIEGDAAARDCLVRYKRGGQVLAVASIYRDLDSLKAELDMERQVVAQ